MSRRGASTPWVITATAFAAGGFLLCLAMTKLRLAPSAMWAVPGRKMKSAVLFGDSITQEAFEPNRMGWVSSLSAYWVRRVDVISRGYGGYNSRWGLEILDEAVVAMNPDVVIIFFGANDAVDTRVPQSVPLDEYVRNLRAIVGSLRSKLSSVTVILMTPPPVYEPILEENNRLKGKALQRDRTVERTGKYANAVISLGEELGLSVVDNFYSMDPTKASREHFFRDGLHLSAEGNQKVFNNIVTIIERDFPELNPEKNEMVWPHWSKVVENPGVL